MHAGGEPAHAQSRWLAPFCSEFKRRQKLQQKAKEQEEKKVRVGGGGSDQPLRPEHFVGCRPQRRSSSAAGRAYAVCSVA